MNQIIDIPIEQIAPKREGVFELQGIPAGVVPHQRVLDLYSRAEELFLATASPTGIMKDISIAEFTAIYPGDGKNEPETPLEAIFPAARALALFAATMGEAVSEKIESLMKSKTNDFALGFMLDSVASYAAEMAAGVGERMFKAHLTGPLAADSAEPEAPAPSTAAEASLKVLLYSPGYCGWHVSGQHRLFDFLEPGRITITLNASALMSPIKSISGLLVAGEANIHNFDNNYSFCDQCRTFNCRARIAN